MYSFCICCYAEILCDPLFVVLYIVIAQILPVYVIMNLKKNILIGGGWSGQAGRPLFGSEAVHIRYFSGNDIFVHFWHC